MRKIVVDVQNYIYAEMIEQTICDSGDFRVLVSESPDGTVRGCKLLQADILFMEVTGYTPWKLCERMKTREAVKPILPYCKIVLMVNEATESEVAEQVKQAKNDGLIDGFVFSSVSTSYLAAYLETV